MKIKKWVIGIGCLVTLLCIAGAILYQNEAKFSEIRSLANASLEYAIDHEMKLPESMADLSTYVKGSTDLNQYEIITTGNLVDIELVTTTVLIRSINVSSKGERAVVFVDGHCEMIYDQQNK